MCVYALSCDREERRTHIRHVGVPVADGEDDDDDAVVTEPSAAAAQQVLQRSRPVASRVGRQEPARRVLHRPGRAQGGRDAGAALRQLAQ